MIDAQKNRFCDLLKEFDQGLLIAQSVDGHLRCRPMAIVEIAADGVVWFITSLNAARVTDVIAHPKVCVTLQQGDQTVSLTGFATTVHDRARIRRCWNEKWRSWFPAGAEDASIVLLRVHPVESEFWNQQKLSSTRCDVPSAGHRPIGMMPQPFARPASRLNEYRRSQSDGSEQ